MVGSSGPRGVVPTDFALKADLAKLSPKLILDGTYRLDAAAGQPKALPAPQDAIGMYAVVEDLFGTKRDLILASTAGGVSFWQPVRPTFAAKRSVTVDSTIRAMRDPSIILADGGLPGVGLFRTFTMSTDMAYPGAVFKFKNRMSGLGTLRLANVNIGTMLSLALGGTVEVVYDPADGWIQL